MIGFRDTSRYDLLPALIVYKGFKDGSSVITIDKGRNDNVKENDIIVDKEGLVGRILSSGSFTSMANMIIEPDVRVSVRINPSRVYGILKWHHGNTFMIEDIPATIDIQPVGVLRPPDYPKYIPRISRWGHHTGHNLRERFYTQYRRQTIMCLLKI